MTIISRPDTLTAPAVITRTVIAVRGAFDTDLTVHHARTPDARITVTLGEVLMVFYSCAAVQGLLAAFTAAKQHSAAIPAEMAAPPAEPNGPTARVSVAVEWTRAPQYAAVPQSALNKARSRTWHWVELYTAAITWQIRDRAALATAIEALTNAHRVAAVTFLDGAEHAADPTAIPGRKASAG